MPWLGPEPWVGGGGGLTGDEGAYFLPFFFFFTPSWPPAVTGFDKRRNNKEKMTVGCLDSGSGVNHRFLEARGPGVFI